ncbi:MAG: hypothetical protein ACTIJ8_06495 [Sphingobacterium sp.]
MNCKDLKKKPMTDRRYSPRRYKKAQYFRILAKKSPLYLLKEDFCRFQGEVINPS